MDRLFPRLCAKAVAVFPAAAVALSAVDRTFWSPATHQREAQDSTCDLWLGDSSTATGHAQFDVTIAQVQP
jgi:hypothetical protein